MKADEQWRRAVASTDTPENRFAHALRLLEVAPVPDRLVRDVLAEDDKRDRAA
jgi:hypothetical protein